jgi:hypothetical protein
MESKKRKFGDDVSTSSSETTRLDEELADENSQLKKTFRDLVGCN